MPGLAATGGLRERRQNAALVWRPDDALATENRISAYDAQYIALARQLQTVCVTEDQRLLKTFPALTRTMQAFAAA